TARAAADGYGRQRPVGGGRRADLRQAQGLRRLRVPRIARVLLRLSRLCQRLAEGAPSGGVLRWVAGRPADGVLLPAVAGGRRPPAGCAGAAGGGVHLRRAGEGGTGRRRRTRGSFGPRSGAGRGGEGGRTGRRRP